MKFGFVVPKTWLYVARFGDRLRIGCSDTPTLAVEVLSRRHDGLGVLLATTAGGPREKRAKQVEFAHLALGGEWFRDDPEIHAWVQTMTPEGV